MKDLTLEDLERMIREVHAGRHDLVPPGYEWDPLWGRPRKIQEPESS